MADGGEEEYVGGGGGGGGKEGEEEGSQTYVQRVSQLDAGDLDSELHALLKEQVSKAFKYIKPRYWSAIEPEFDALLRLIILAASVRACHATVGQRLLNIRYRSGLDSKKPSNGTLLTFVMTTVGAYWLKSREDDLVLYLNKHPVTQNAVRRSFHLTEVAVHSLMLLNSLCFLVEGKYSMLLERVLRLKPVHATPQDIRHVSYDYLNRELLWHGFAEFFAFVLPMFNVRRLVNVVCRYMPFLQFEEPTMPSQRSRADYLECIICNQSPTLPHDIGCSHVFCYYCIASNVNVDPNYRCPRCGFQVNLDDPIKLVTVR